MIRRSAWGLADQAVSSLTNFVMSFAVLSGLSIETFGAFTIAYAAYTVALGLQRGAISEVVVVRYSDVSDAEWRRAAVEATGAAIPLAIGGSLLAVAAGLLIGGEVGPGLVALAVVLPGLMLQDVWRFAFFAQGSPQRAFTNDLVWGVLQIAAVLAVLAGDGGGAAAFVLAWGLAGTVAGLFGIAQTRLWPAPARTWRWLRSHRDLGARYVAEAALRRGAPQATLMAIGAIAGLGALGRINAARVLLGPINIVYLGFVAVGVPEGVRLWRARPERLPPATRTAALVLSGLAVAAGAILLGVPAGLGERILDNWDEALTYLLPVTIAVAANGGVQAMIAGLRSLAAAERSLRAQVGMSVLTVCGGVAGAAIAGGWGAAIGLAGGRVAAALVSWRAFELEVGERLGRIATGGAR